MALQGTYFGYEAMANLSPDRPDAFWYHEVTLSIDGSKVRVEKDPRYKVGEKVIASASDGGFQILEGVTRYLAGRTIIELHQVSCDYCGEILNDALPPEVPREYVVLFARDGSFELDGVRYSRAKKPSLSVNKGG